MAEKQRTLKNPAVIEDVILAAWSLTDLLNDWLDAHQWDQGKDDLLKSRMAAVSDAIEQRPLWSVE